VQAVDRGTDGASVLVVGPDKKVERRSVRLGLETPYVVQILDGVHEGEMVIVGNLAGFEPGQKVNPRLSAMAASGKGE
jgi:hypothetical protein